MRRGKRKSQKTGPAALRRFRRRWPGALVVIIILIVFVIADRQGWLLVEKSDEWTRYEGHTFNVARIVDGDTIEIEVYDMLERRPTTKVRLWGIDCPEVAHPGYPNADPWGEEATAFMKDILIGSVVTVHLESSRVRDKYDRLLAHLDLPDGRRVNVLLLEAGLAEADDRWPHGELDRYERAERTAKTNDRGLWSDD